MLNKVYYQGKKLRQILWAICSKLIFLPRTKRCISEMKSKIQRDVPHHCEWVVQSPGTNLDPLESTIEIRAVLLKPNAELGRSSSRFALWMHYWNKLLLSPKWSICTHFVFFSVCTAKIGIEVVTFCFHTCEGLLMCLCCLHLLTKIVMACILPLNHTLGFTHL